MENTFEHIYDKYSTMLYGIAMEISSNDKVAEDLLLSTFLKFHKQHLAQQLHPSACTTLINLLIQTAHEQLNDGQLKKNFKLKQFKNTPLLHKILCEQVNLDNHCSENNLSPSDLRKKIREEFILLRKIQNVEVRTSKVFQLD